MDMTRLQLPTVASMASSERKFCYPKIKCNELLMFHLVLSWILLCIEFC